MSFQIDGFAPIIAAISSWYDTKFTCRNELILGFKNEEKVKKNGNLLLAPKLSKLHS